jgi:transposase-like protein
LRLGYELSRWYRAYEGTVTDAKLAEAAPVADVSRAVSIAAWHCLLESAANVNNCGGYETSPRRVSIILCEPPAAVEALFAAYAEIGLIKDGVVLSWRKRQHESDSSTERTRKWREKKQQETAECDAGDGDETSRDAPETEAETERESSNEDSSSGDEPDASPEHVFEFYQDLPDRDWPPGASRLHARTPAARSGPDQRNTRWPTSKPCSRSAGIRRSSEATAGERRSPSTG